MLAWKTTTDKLGQALTRRRPTHWDHVRRGRRDRTPQRRGLFTSASSPRRTINVAGTINPASATSVSSSKVTSMRSITRDTRLTGSASRVVGHDDFEHRHRPSPGRLSADTRPLDATSPVDRGAGADPNVWVTFGPVAAVRIPRCWRRAPHSTPCGVWCRGGRGGGAGRLSAGGRTGRRAHHRRAGRLLHPADSRPRYTSGRTSSSSATRDHLSTS